MTRAVPISGKVWDESFSRREKVARAPDEGSPPHDTSGSPYDWSERTALTRRFAPPSPGGRGIPPKPNLESCNSGRNRSQFGQTPS
jgi:hypothetical protein